MKDEVLKKRPILITLVCVISFAGALFSIALFVYNPIAFRSTLKALGSWFLPNLICSTLIGLTSFIGLWYMRKWSVYVYTIFCLVNQIILFCTVGVTIVSLLIPGIIILIMWIYIGRMY